MQRWIFRIKNLENNKRKMVTLSMQTIVKKGYLIGEKFVGVMFRRLKYFVG